MAAVACAGCFAGIGVVAGSAAVGRISGVARVADTPPTNSVPPAISGEARVGQTLSADPGVWSPTSDYAYQWQRCGSYSAAVAADQPVGWWRLGDLAGSSAALDASGYGNDGIAQSVTFGRPGALGSSNGEIDTGASFTGALGGSQIVVPDSDALDSARASVSIEAWVWDAATTGATRAMVFKGYTPTSVATPQYALLELPNFQVSFVITINGIASTVTAAVANAWTHVVGVYDGDAMHLYVNGAEAASRLVTGSIDVYGQPLDIGSGPNTSAWYPYSGQLDEVSVYASPLSSNRVLAHYNAASSGCTDIGNATNQSYAPDPADLGSRLRVNVTASDTAGSTAAASAETALVSNPRPHNTAAPQISGATTLGSTLSATTGSWSGSPTGYVYQWQRCGSYEAAVAADSPVAWWRLGEGDGASTAVDVAGFDDGPYNHVTLGRSGALGIANGELDSGASFGGGYGASAPQIAIPDSSVLDPTDALTIEAWVVAPSVSNDRGIVYKGMASNSIAYLQYALLQSSGGVAFELKQFATSADMVWASVPATTWSHVAATYDGTTMRLYINGSLKASKTAPGLLGSGNGQPLDIGSFVNTNNWFSYQGSLDEVALYGSALSGDRILAHYNAAPSGCSDVSGATASTYGLTSADIGSRMRVIVTAISSAGNAAKTSGEAAVTGQGPPKNTAVPTISGTAQQGQTLTGDVGVWSGAQSKSVVWQRCDASGEACADIAGATSATYVPVADDIGSSLRFSVTASNARGSATVVSAAKGVVQTGAPVIAAGQSPRVGGLFNAGQLLTANPGTWTNNPTSFTYQWYRCDPSGQCTATGSSASTFETSATSDVGYSFKFTVVASNQYGESSPEESTETPALIDQGILDQMAQAYRPALLFDSGEAYRPITVDSLLAEGVHQRCDVNFNCTPINSVSALTVAALDGDYLAIHSTPDGVYESPNCPPDAIRLDCLDQPGIYYDFGQSAAGYRFFDYWFFYRYNPMNLDVHEGDWEGITVELAPTPATFAPSIQGVIFWRHGHPEWTLPASLKSCEDAAASPAACAYGQQGSTATSHVAAFVARDSHASYSYECDSSCTNDAHPGLAEGDHDGAAGWSDNSDASCTSDTCVTPMTFIDNSLSAPSWPTWVGKWGASDGTIIGTGISPDSPGLQTPFTCTQAGWACSSAPSGLPLRRLQRRDTTEPFAPGECSTWFNVGLGAFACSPRQLARTAKQHAFDQAGVFKLTTSGRHTGTAPGVVQIVGGPLHDGGTVRFAGHPQSDEIVAINCLHLKRVYTIVLTHLHLTATSATARITIGRDGRPHLKLSGLSARQSTRVAG